MSKTAEILVLGIGNVLWADEGFGVRAVEEMASLYEFENRVTLLDGGTQGLYLLPFLERADGLIVFDAVDYGMTPGTMKIVRDEEVPAFMGAKKMSLHQTGFQDVLATAAFVGRAPAKQMLIGVQPVELEDYGGGLRDEVAAQIGPAIEIALKELSNVYGAAARRRATPGPMLADQSIARSAYEDGRPSADDAYRFGDARFLAGRRA